MMLACARMVRLSLTPENDERMTAMPGVRSIVRQRTGCWSGAAHFRGDCSGVYHSRSGNVQ